MNKWVVYCAGNADYILSPNAEPIKMLKSFRKHFGNEIDYVYFTDKDEANIRSVQDICDAHDIKLVVGECKRHYDKYNDYEYVGERGLPPRWPDAHYWYCEAPDYFNGTYEFAIKCDGDMMCVQKFDLSSLESDNEITAAHAPDWYNSYDRHCANAGFQVINISAYVKNDIKSHFRQFSNNINTYKKFNGDTPVLNHLVGSNTLNVRFVSAEYNYLLFDIDEVKNLSMDNMNDVKIVHFVETKPHNLNEWMYNTVKEHFANIYRAYQ